MNMSYCRFQNTLNDLRDCAENINDATMSKDELYARNLLVKTCNTITQEAEEISVEDLEEE